MSDSWIWAALAIIGGIVVGAVIGRAARTLLANPKRRPALAEIAPVTGIFLFWISVATGIVLAVAATSPDTLEPIPSRVLSWLPNALIAGLLLIVGSTLGATIGAAVGRAATRAGGRRQPALERTMQSTVLAAAIVLALAQLGVNTTILNILVAAAAFGVAAALAGITIVGSRGVARNLAAGRSLAVYLPTGRNFRTSSIEGSVVESGTTHVVVDRAGGGRVLIPWSTLEAEAIELVD